MEWISVKDRPLIITTTNGWEATRDGDKEFMAAILTNKGWWIRHCILKDEIGLCVIGDNDDEVAGWNIEDVEFWSEVDTPYNE